MSIQYSAGEPRSDIAATAEKLAVSVVELLQHGGTLGEHDTLHIGSILSLLVDDGLRQDVLDSVAGSKGDSPLNRAILGRHRLDSVDGILPLHEPYARVLTGHSAAPEFRSWIEHDWYDHNSGLAWHDEHWKSPQSYLGYWCFEGAAVASIMGFDTSTWTGTSYWPGDLL